jgi:predicted permease
MRRAASAIESVIQDLRYGARLLRRAPWFTCVGIGSLAIGLGGAIALFTVTNALLFRPLPGRGTADIHSLFTSNRGGGRYGPTSFADFQSFVAAAPPIFSRACATTPVTGNLTVGAAVQPLAGAIFSGGCFDALGVRPFIGRLLNPSDDAEPGGIVLSHALWTRGFAADPSAVGRAVLLNGTSAVIVGVAEPGFAGVSLDGGAEFWVPPQAAAALLSPGTLSSRAERRFRVYVRLADGVTRAQAAERLAAIAARLRGEDPVTWAETSGATRTVTIVREIDSRFASAAGAVEAIGTGTAGAIAAILAMACVNLATMFLARGAARRHELSVRLALGASRLRLLRQLVTESLLIAIGATVAGVAVVAAALEIFDAYRPAEVPAVNLAVDWRVATFALLMAMLAPVFFGAAPGLHAIRLAIAEGLKRHRRFGSRELLLGTQIVASFALLVASSLFMRSLAAGGASPHGFSTGLVGIVPVDFNTAARSGDDINATVDRLLLAAGRVPGVDTVTAAALVPMTGSYTTVDALPEDRPDAVVTGVDANIVSPGYFELLGIGVRTGRTFDRRDRARAPEVAVVSESLAKRLWDTAGAVGRTLRVDDVPREVIGVVADVPYRSVSDASHAVVYVPAAQAPRRRLLVHARVKNEGEAIAALDRAIRDVDARILVGRAISMRQLMDETRIGGRIAQGVGVIAGALELGLALMATWGLVAYAVERRTTEIAIRRALGATEASVQRLVMRPSLWLLAIGAPIGCATGMIAATALHSTFLGLAPLDLRVALPAVAALTPVVVLAAWLPARRAIATEPAAALKQS